MADETQRFTQQDDAGRDTKDGVARRKDAPDAARRTPTGARFADPSDAPDRATRGAGTRHARVEKNPKDAPDVTTKTPIYRRPLFLVTAAVVLLVAALIGLRFYLHARSHESTDDAFIEGNAVQVSPQVAGTVLKVYVADNQWVKAGELVAELDARDYETRLQQARAALMAAEARHEQALANVSLTRTVSYANVAQSAAGVETAQAQAVAAERGAQAREGNVAQASAGVRTAQANLEQAQADERAAEAQAVRDERDVERYKTLFENDAVSQQRLDQAIAAARTSRAQFDAAHKRTQAAAAQVSQAAAVHTSATREYGQALAQTDAARAQVGEARGRLTEANAAPERVLASSKQANTAEAEIAQARETVAQAELDLSYTKIYAPESGRVTRKSIDEGQLARIGQPLLAIVYGDMWVTANFKETQLTEMRVGQPVEIKVDAYPDKTFRGRVESFQYGTGARFSALPPQNATGNYVKVVQRVPVKILFDEQPNTNLLAPGMSVVPEVNISAVPDPKAIRRGYGTEGGSTEGGGGGGGTGASGSDSGRGGAMNGSGPSGSSSGNAGAQGGTQDQQGNQGQSGGQGGNGQGEQQGGNGQGTQGGRQSGGGQGSGQSGGQSGPGSGAGGSGSGSGSSGNR